MTLVVIPNVDAESYEEFRWDARGLNTHAEYFQGFSNWASDNKDILGKDVSFWSGNMETKADFTVSNISLIPLEKEFHYILSFDTNVKLKSEVRYPTEFVMDGRLLTVMDDKTHEALGGYAHEECYGTGIKFNSESGDSGTFHSCFGMIGYDKVGNKGAGEIEGVAIYVKDRLGDRQPISVFYMADIENTGEKTISVQEIGWLDGIINFFKSLFG